MPTVGTGAWTTATFTPPSNCFLLARLAALNPADDGMEGTDLTIADSLGGSWGSPIVATTGSPNWSYGDAVYGRRIGRAEPMTISGDAGAFNVGLARIEIHAFTGYKLSAPVGGTIVGTDADGNGAASITLSAAPSPESIVLAGSTTVVGGAGTVASTPGAEYTLIQNYYLDTWGCVQSQFRRGPTSATVSWADLQTGTASPLGSVLWAFEIQAEAERPQFEARRRVRYPL